MFYRERTGETERARVDAASRRGFCESIGEADRKARAFVPWKEEGVMREYARR